MLAHIKAATLAGLEIFERLIYLAVLLKAATSLRRQTVLQGTS